jgi:RNA polymerase sigma-B factor
MVAESFAQGTAATGDLPEIPSPPSAASPARARAVTRPLLHRLRGLPSGTPEHAYLRGVLVELNLSLVRHVVRRFRARSESSEELLQVGCIGLIHAVDRFQVDRGVEFSTFAVPTIEGEIKCFFRDASWCVRVPRRLQELRLRIARCTDELQQRTGREPTVAELAEALGADERETLLGLEAVNAYDGVSLDAVFGEADAGAALSERLAAPDDGIERVETAESLRPLLAGLPERERTVLALRFGAELTQAEIADRIGVSQMQVSRILSRTCDALRGALAESVVMCRD